MKYKITKMKYTATIPVEIEVEITVTESQDEDGINCSYDWSRVKVAADINTAIADAIENLKSEIHEQR